MRHIAIVGAGFSGAATAIQLLRLYGDEELAVTLINRHPDQARGVAYGTRSPSHVLNVPAGRMSLFPDDEEDFLRYAQAHDRTIQGGDFVPRSLYGAYLAARLREAAANARHARLVSVTGEAVDLGIKVEGGAAIEFVDSTRMEADKVVLTTGNYPPADPPLADRGFYDSPLYVRDPWAPGALDRLVLDQPVLLVGTGLTMVDVALELKRRGLRAQMFGLSRRGLLPQAHRREVRAPLAPPLVGEMLLQGPGSVRRYLRVLRLAVDEMRTTGTDWRDIVGGLRQITPALWWALTEEERRRFLRHLQPYWDTHRHRMAPAVAQALAALLGTRQLVIASGRIVTLATVGESGVNVIWRPRATDDNLRLEVSAVVNCTGPQTNLTRVEDRLIRSLLKQGLLRPDPLNLGVEVDESDALLDKFGRPSQVLFYTGPLLRARYWECTAVPELRAAAARLALRVGKLALGAAEA